MYVLDGIAYAGEPGRRVELARVLSVRPLPDYKLRVKFSTGEERLFDAKPLLKRRVFRPLKDVSVFNGVYADGGVPVWLDGEIDYCPDALYAESVPVQTVER